MLPPCNMCYSELHQNNIFLPKNQVMKWLWIISVFFFNNISAQIPELTFRQLSPSGGLSFQSIHSITQDHDGCIWLGSNQGIFRYDSRNFTRFCNNPNNPNSLITDAITQLIVDNQNNLWIGTFNGLELFNRETQDFIHFEYKHNSEPVKWPFIYSMGIDEEGNLWIIDYNGLGVIDKEARTIKYVQSKYPKFRPRIIYFDRLQRGWIGTANGSIYRIHHGDHKITKVIDGPGSIPRTIWAEGDKIWVGYTHHGARLYNMQGNLLRHYCYDKNKTWDFRNGNVRSIIKDAKGDLLIGAYQGLFIEKDNEIYRIDPELNPEIVHNSIYSVFRDNRDNIWFGTWSGGLFYMNNSDNKFYTYRHSENPSSLSNNFVSSFAQLTNGQIFIGTETGGLNEFNPTSATFKKVNLADNKKKVFNIKSLCTDKQGGLWVGTHKNHLWYKPSGSENFTHFNGQEGKGYPASAQSVYALCPSDSGVWIGCLEQGVYFYHFARDHIYSINQLFSAKNRKIEGIRSLLLDSHNGLWVGSVYWLSRLNLITGKMHHFTGKKPGKILNSNTIYHLNEVTDNEIWIGTKAGGINIYHFDTDSISYFNPEQQLTGKDVYGILKDSGDRIWITTNAGLFLYNPINKSLRQFNMVDGIQGNQFNPQSIFMDSDKNLYFGGTNGFTQIKKGRIRLNKRAPDIILNKVVVNNKREIYSFPHSENTNFNSLNLKPSETSFKIEFVADNFLLSEKNRFKYRLLGIYDEWIDNGNLGSAVFTNIPYGEYIFEVKAANNDGIWNDEPARLHIIISTPWWRTNLAYLCYFLVSALMLFLIYKVISERQQLKKNVLFEKFRRTQEENLHEMKLKFFTNISHEFRTPLTLITGPLKNILKAGNLNPVQIKNLDVIQRNSNRLLGLINQIMDLRKIEKGKAKLNIERFDLVPFIRERYLSFTEEARIKQIDLKYITTNKINIEADSDKVDKIIFNLLSNAFKNTGNNGEIIIEITKGGRNSGRSFTNRLKFGDIGEIDFVEFSVADSGKGIASEDLVKIFNRFEQGKPNEFGSGIGLSLCKDFTLLHHGEIMAASTPKKGSCFTVRLPLKQAAHQIFQSKQYSTNALSPELPQQSKKDIHVHTNNKVNHILIVEDNNDLREYIKDVLSPFYSTTEAIDGAEALEYLLDSNVDIVVSDVMMPKMDGFELCAKIKSRIETSHIPVILLTSLSSIDNKIAGLEKGADAYIPKPFDEELLITQINNLLKQRELLRQTFRDQIIKNQPFDGNTPGNYFLDKTRETIEKHFSNPDFTVEMLASEIGLCRVHLHRKLKQMTNYSATEFIRMIRLKKASEMLKYDQFSVDEIAYQVGFNSHSYFSKSFKRHYKMTPKEYKQRYTDEDSVNRNNSGYVN